jgi:hypothetical protein
LQLILKTAMLGFKKRDEGFDKAFGFSCLDGVRGGPRAFDLPHA